MEEKVEQVLHSGDRLIFAEKASRCFVLYPRIIFSVTWSTILAISAYVFLKGYFTIEDTTQFDWYVAESEASNTADALASALEMSDIVKSSLEVSDGNYRTIEASYFKINIIYEWADLSREDIIINPSNLQLFCQFQSLFTGGIEYKKFCVTKNADGLNTTCTLLQTDIVKHFYATEEDRFLCPLLNETSFFTMLTQFSNNPFSTYFYDENFPNSSRTRSSIVLGGPLGPDSTIDGSAHTILLDSNTGPQYASYKNFFDSFEEAVFDEYNLQGGLFYSPYRTGRITLGDPDDDVTVRYESIYFRNVEFFRTVETDQLLVGGAVVFVLIMMYLHLKSLFLAVMGMMTIVLALPVALFIYTYGFISISRVIFGISYFTSVHVIAIFLLLGVGADNIFVFVDAWKQSSTLWVNLRGIQNQDAALQKNIYGTFDADEEVLVARLSYTYSRSIGAIFNTASTTAAAFFATSTSPVIPVAAFGIYAAISIIVNFCWILLLQPVLVVLHHRYIEQAFCCKRRKEKGNRSKRLTPDEFVIFRGYIPLMSSSRLVPVICAITLGCLIGFMGYSALQLPVPSTQEEQFRTEHMFHGFVQDYVDLFLGGAASEFMAVRLFWGIVEQDRSNFFRFDPNGNRGEPVFDPAFEIASQESQQYVLDACNLLRNYSCTNKITGKKPEGCTQGNLVFPDEVICFMEEFHAWHSLSYSNNVSLFDLGDSNPEEFHRLLYNFTLESRNNEDPSRNFEKSVGFIDGQLKFVVVDFVTTMKIFQPSGVKEPVFDVMDQLLVDMKSLAPAALQSVLQTSFDLVWINTELGIVDGMFSGLAISFPIAFLVLLFASGNIILAFLSILSIIGIVSSVLGTAYHLGWSLGIGEAISAVMVIGLSVDYVIHLSHMYVVAGKQGIYQREGRFEFAASKMGPTVVAGAVTTAGACAVMFVCELTVFSKMGALIVMTVAYSVLFAFFFFLTVVKLIGPEGKFGQLDYWIMVMIRNKGSISINYESKKEQRDVELKVKL